MGINYQPPSFFKLVCAIMRAMQASFICFMVGAIAGITGRWAKKGGSTAKPEDLDGKMNGKAPSEASEATTIPNVDDLSNSEKESSDDDDFDLFFADSKGASQSMKRKVF